MFEDEDRIEPNLYPSLFDLNIMGYRLECTCYACPEQYDVYDSDGKMVAYFRLRHGRFDASVPDVGGTIVYESYPKGDGSFDDAERYEELTKALEKVKEHYYK